MLTIAKLGIGQQNYYLSKVASGIEDYYSGRGEVAGSWIGRGASRLGLGGRVRAGQLGKLMDGIDPRTSDRLAGRDGVARVPGWDLTFSAPKSVSVLYGLGDARTAAEVVAAHEAAVAEGVAYTECYAACSRRRTDGDITTVRAEGLAIAAFRHRTSRAGDPQLHTHALAVNLVELVDGGWGALHSPVIYRHARTAGFVYQAVLRGELTERLGVAWDEVHNGYAEIAGIDPLLVQVFSKRRHEINAALELRGEHSARAAQVAAHSTRSTKEYGVDPDTLRQQWADEALAVGVAPASVQEATGNPQRVVTTLQLEQAIEEMVSARGLTQHDATFDRRDVMRAWCEALPAGTKVRLADLVALSDDLLADPDVETISDGLDRLRGHEIVYRADGTPTTASHVEARWSTSEMLAVERRLLDMALQARGAGAGRVPAESVERRLASRPDLSAEQAAMVRQVTTSGAGVDLVVGRAGTGKTYALAVAARAWDEAGFHVMGLALAARAADQLENGAGIPSGTVAQFLCDADRMPGGLVTDRHVLVVDEAGMVDTRRLAQVVAIARRTGAKILLVGDHHQLPAVEAGGAFAALITHLGATELSENRRQVEPWERQALEQLRTGSPEHGGIIGVLAAYQREGRLHVGISPTQVRRDMVQAWYAEHCLGRNVGMIALRRRDVDDLNTAARALLVADGTVTDDRGVRVGPRTFGTGDRVVCTRGDRWLGVHNALFATIVDTDRATGAIAIQPDGRSRGPMCIPHWFVAAGHLRHAYATTIHKAQGATYDHTLVYGDERLYRQAGYTGLSRGRYRNDLYIIDIDTRLQESDLEQHGEPAVDPDAYQRIIRALSRDGAKTLAIARRLREPCWAPARPLGDLWAERDQLIEDDAAASPTPSTTATDRVASRVAELNDTIRHQRRHGGLAAEVDRPHHILEQLGEPPAEAAAREHWRRAAAAIQSYQARWDVDPVGAEHQPADPLQQDHAAHVVDAIEFVRSPQPASGDIGIVLGGME